MAIALGKRKRRTQIESSQDDGNTPDDGSRLHALLQRHFEASYKPLDIEPLAPSGKDGSEDSESDEWDSEDDWGGISDSGAPETVEVVEHAASDLTDDVTAKLERRSFMSNKPPSAVASGKSKGQKQAKPEKEDPLEAVNLKNDVALQRLLQESSLLQKGQTGLGTIPSSVHPTVSSFEHIGKARHKALDLRMQSLGAEGSLFDQKKRPLTHRFGMVEKKRTKEAERRREAKENGIILEKEVKQSKKSSSSDRSRRGIIGGAVLGKMRGGTLVLSNKDVRQIQGPGKSGKPHRPTKRRR